MAVDMRGTFLVTKFLLPLMMEQGGSIINTASFSGQAADLYRSDITLPKVQSLTLRNLSLLNMVVRIFVRMLLHQEQLKHH